MNIFMAEASASPARRAWLQSVKNARHTSETAEDGHADSEESTYAPVVEESTPTATETSAATSAVPMPPADTPPVDAVRTPIDNSTSIARAMETPSNANTDQTRADKIGNMQQMFQQRMQINQSQNPATPQR